MDRRSRRRPRAADGRAARRRGLRLDVLRSRDRHGAFALTSLNESWFARAQRVLPGGVDSPVRSFRSVGGTPYTVARGSGAYVEDVDGTKYLDFVQSYGASLLGHAHPDVVKALSEAVAEGTTFGAPTPGEVLLAETMCARVPGLEQVRLVSSGTEALMS